MSLDVEGILHSIGVEVIKERGDELIARCPMHLARTGTEDANPSWSINEKTYVHHCFSCGYSGTLNMLYRDMVGEVPEDLEWELSKQSIQSVLTRPKEAPQAGPTISEWALKNYVDVPTPLLERRYLHRSSADFFGIRWDREKRIWVIPIRTPSGELMGFQFRQKGLVLNHPTGMEKSKTLFGFHLFRGEERITVVESPLDAVRFWNIGVPAVSSFGAAVSTDQMKLLSRNYRYIIAAMDNDSPGQRASAVLHKTLTNRGCSVFRFDYAGLGVKDPGDVESDAVLREAWERSTFSMIRETT